MALRSRDASRMTNSISFIGSKLPKAVFTAAAIGLLSMPFICNAQAQERVVVGSGKLSLADPSKDTTLAGGHKDVISQKQLTLIKQLQVKDQINAIAWSSDGAKLATISHFGSVVTLWDSEKWDQIKEFKRYAGSYSFNSLAFLPDGSLLTAAPGGDYSKGINFESESVRDPRYSTLELFSLIRWDVNDAKPLSYIPELGYPPKGDLTPKVTNTFSVSKDGSLVAGIGGVEVLLYNSLSGKLVSKLQVPPVASHGDQAMSVAFSPDGSQLAIGTLFGQLHFYDLKTGAIISSIKAYDSLWYGCSALAYSPDGKYIAVGKHDLSTGQLVNNVWTNKKPSNINVTIWRVSDHALTASLDGSTMKQNIGDDAVSVMSLSWNPEGNLLAVGDDLALRVWDVQKETPALLLVKAGDPGGVYSVNFSSAGALAAAMKNQVFVYQPTP